MSDASSSAAASQPPPSPSRARKPEAPGGGWRGALLGAALGGALAAAGWAVVQAADADAVREVNAELRRQFGGWGKPVAVGVMVLVAWAVIGWHELGHVVAGALARFRFHVYILGPLRVERDVGTGQIGARYNRELGTWGGMAGSFPQDARDLRRRVAMLLAGGPLASLLLAAAAVIALAAAAGAMSPLVRGVVAIAGLFSGGIGLVTLLPMRGTDGGRLLRLKRGGPPAEREAAVFGIVGLLTSGVRRATGRRHWPTRRWARPTARPRTPTPRCSRSCTPPTCATARAPSACSRAWPSCATCCRPRCVRRSSWRRRSSKRTTGGTRPAPAR
jgi:hypothetical protein